MVSQPPEAVRLWNGQSGEQRRHLEAARVGNVWQVSATWWRHGQWYTDWRAYGSAVEAVTRLQELVEETPNDPWWSAQQPTQAQK